jgi:hypothetical protein
VGGVPSPRWWDDRQVVNVDVAWNGEDPRLLR